MIIEDTFFIAKLTEITLLHIFLFLGVPYIIFYFFEKTKKFDKFSEKWEAALFIFSIEGFIILISLYLKNSINFITYYILLNSILMLSLIIYVEIKIGKNCFLFKIKGKNLGYKGEVFYQNGRYIVLKKTKKNPLKKIKDGREEIMEESKIYLRKENISKIIS